MEMVNVTLEFASAPRSILAMTVLLLCAPIIAVRSDSAFLMAPVLVFPQELVPIVLLNNAHMTAMDEENVRD